MESKECRICHRIGYRGFVGYGESMWRCFRDDLCDKRRSAKGYDRLGNMQVCARCGDPREWHRTVWPICCVAENEDGEECDCTGFVQNPPQLVQ